ncbi:hypothetical protein [Micromonospora sp. NBC_00421]|uniref:hypothetical protein n=1 Tax=Micromonospora sp. NBC_00421 TaxID=2975976 RepID=UPI002E1D2DC7
MIDAMAERLLRSPSRIRILMSSMHIYEWIIAWIISIVIAVPSRQDSEPSFSD